MQRDVIKKIWVNYPHGVETETEIWMIDGRMRSSKYC